MVQKRYSDEPTHQILSYGLLFLLFYPFPYTTDPPTCTTLPRPSCDHHQLYPIPIAPSVQYHIRDLPYDLWTTLFIFSFLSLFSFTQCILSRPNQSQVIVPCGQDLTIRFAAHKPCARFTYRLYLRLLYLLRKTKKFSDRKSVV